jgi:pheromone shutdown-related protein TraB
MGIFEKIKMIWALVISIAEVDKGQEIDIESLKEQNVIDMVMEEFRKFSPNGARALIDERDAFIAHQLVLLKLQRPEARILAVVGAGHRQGISNYLDNPATLPPFDSLVREPKSFPWAKIFGFAVTGLFAFLLAAIAFSGVGWNVLLYAFLFWVVIHGVLAALFTLLAGGHPYSALTCFCVAWMTSLNPMLHAGWIAAYVEARVRKPPITDFRKIYESETLGDMAKIPLFRVVLVAALANLGSLLGTILYFIFVFPVIGVDPAVVISTGISNMWKWMCGIF